MDGLDVDRRHEDVAPEHLHRDRTVDALDLAGHRMWQTRPGISHDIRAFFADCVEGLKLLGPPRPLPRVGPEPATPRGGLEPKAGDRVRVVDGSSSYEAELLAIEDTHPDGNGRIRTDGILKLDDGEYRIVDFGNITKVAAEPQTPRPPDLPRELRDAGWSIELHRTGRWFYQHQLPGGRPSTQYERPGWPDAPVEAPLRRTRPLDRDPFRALPADVVGRILENFALDPWVRDALGHAALDRNGRREWKNDAALADLLAFGVCSKACQRAATTDALWSERTALLERTHVCPSEPADAGAWRPPSLDVYVDPRIFHPKAYAAYTCFRQYRDLARVRNNMRWKLQRLRNEKHWTTRDRAKLAEVADLAREALEGNQAEEAEDATLPKHDLTTCTRHSYEDCFKFCENYTVARTIVQYAMRQLDGGADGHVRTLIVRGFADVNVTGLISQEYDHDPEDEWDADDNVAFAVSGCGSLNPFRFEFDEWEPEEEPEAAA
jgi:hypothetical protein